MSIIMKNVNSITLGGVSVNKIEDKNGNVLWEKPTSSTPYRKLDYIKFSGNEYVELSTRMPLDNAIFEVTFQYTYLNNNQTIFGTGSTNRDYDVQTNSEYIFAKSSSIYSNLVDNGKYKLTVNTGSSTSKTSVSTSVYDYQNGTTKNTSRKLNNDYALLSVSYIGCFETDSTKSNYFKSKLFEFHWKSKVNVITPEMTLVPCQRKSDNVCGLYDTTNNKFLPMEGTVITDGARGNIIDENWDVK